MIGVVGIDLGATYSKIAVPGNTPLEGLKPIPACPGYLVVHEPLRDFSIPSVVAADIQGNIIVGHNAKALYWKSPRPVMLSKRFMRDEKKFPIDHDLCVNSTEISAHILKYLKCLAENRLDRRIDNAVLSIPSDFPRPQREMIVEALQMAEFKQFQLVPDSILTARAFHACFPNLAPNRPHRIMIYDLGGETFKVAIIQILPGQTPDYSILAVDGDNSIGGTSFDRILALWILNRLIQDKYLLRFDMYKPENIAFFDRLIIFAENVKKSLSQDDKHSIKSIPLPLVDLLPMEITITRGEYEAMIDQTLDHTLDICLRLMTEKITPPIDIDQIEEILITGGSSYIPLVSQKIELAFGKKPICFEPSLCVALGAAITASYKYTQVDTREFESLLVPEQTPISTPQPPPPPFLPPSPDTDEFDLIRDKTEELYPDENLVVEIEEPDGPSLEELINTPVKKPVEKPFEKEKPFEVLTQVPFEIPIDVPLEEPLEIPLEDSIEIPGEAWIQEPVEVPVIVEPPVEEPLKKNLEQTSEEPIEIPGEELIEEEPIIEPVKKTIEAAIEAPIPIPGEETLLLFNLDEVEPDNLHEIDELLKDASSDSHAKLQKITPPITEPPPPLEIPRDIVDMVCISLTYPVFATPGKPFNIELWAYKENQMEEIIQRAKEKNRGLEVRIKSIKPVRLTPGTLLTIYIKIHGLTIETPENTIPWERKIGNTFCSISIPPEMGQGLKIGEAKIYAGPFLTAEIGFSIQIHTR